MVEILIMVLVGILGYFIGQNQIKKTVEQINENFAKPDYKNSIPKQYEDFLYVLRNSKFPVSIDYILDIVFNYGYNEGWNNRDRVHQEDIDKMVNELADEYENEHFSGNIELSAGTKTNKEEKQ